jgi:hypothetical protein
MCRRAEQKNYIQIRVKMIKQAVLRSCGQSWESFLGEVWVSLTGDYKDYKFDFEFIVTKWQRHDPKGQ